MPQTCLLTVALPLTFRSLDFPKALFHLIQNRVNITFPVQGAVFLGTSHGRERSVTVKDESRALDLDSPKYEVFLHFLSE